MHVEPSDSISLSLVCPPEQIAPRVLLLPFLNVELLHGCFDRILYEFNADGFFSGLTGEKAGMQLTVIRCGTGSVKIIDAVLGLQGRPIEQLAFAGTCSGLAPDLSIGDIIVPSGTYIVRDIEDILEDRFVAPIIKPLTGAPAEQLKKVLSATDSQRVVTGPVASIPSVFLMRDELSIHLRDRGFASIDLESSYLHQVCPALRVTPLIQLTVADLPLSKPASSLSRDDKHAVRDRHLAQVQTLTSWLLDH